MKVKVFNKYNTPVDIDYPIPVEIYIDQFNFDPIPEGSLRIVMLEEPLRDKLYDYALKNQHLYNYLLTYEDDLLKKVKKARLFRCTDTWVKGFVPPERKFCVSTVVGGKDDNRMGGYAMRHELWERQEEIKIPKEFFLSSQCRWVGGDYNSVSTLVLGDSKRQLFNSMFHIAIENRPMKHYYTEKLIDCFETRTVPIYIGCENIADYFEPMGMFIAGNIRDVIGICNKLTPDDYYSRAEYIEDNYQRAQSHTDYVLQLNNKIKEILDEHKRCTGNKS